MKVIKQYAHMLAATSPETLEKIKQFEGDGKFNEHLDTAAGGYVPVDGGYEYIPKSPLKRFSISFKKFFVVRPFMRYVNKMFKTEVTGREHLKAIGKKGCIVCCNHVNKLDCMAINYALRGKTVYTTAAEFNNLQGFLGDMMRAGGLLPFGGNYAAAKNFNAALNKLLKRGRAVTFFPERAEWWCYEKPRPLLSGAYKYAVKFNVPVLPVFITFKPSANPADPSAIKQFVVNILPPLYPDPSLAPSQAYKRLMQGNEKAWQNCYDEFYKTPQNG